MDTTFKDSLQSKFLKNYNLFLKIEINGTNFEIMPSQKDIPIIDSVVYNKVIDVLEILLKNEKGAIQNVRINDNLTIILNEEHQIVGFNIFNFKELVKNDSSKKISEKLEATRESLEPLNLKESIKENYIKRNLHSIKEFILVHGPQLVY